MAQFNLALLVVGAGLVGVGTGSIWTALGMAALAMYARAES